MEDNKRSPQTAATVCEEDLQKLNPTLLLKVIEMMFDVLDRKTESMLRAIKVITLILSLEFFILLIIIFS